MGGGDSHDVSNDAVFKTLLRNAHTGYYRAVIAAPPCSTFSISRFFNPNDGKPGPPPVRDRQNILGLAGLDPSRKRELKRANELVLRTIAICLACFSAGGDFLIENPADRGDRSVSHFMDERHGPLWLHPAIIKLEQASSCERISS